MSRKLFVLLLLFTSALYSVNLKASHMAGGEIWYEYAGNTTYPYRYNIYLILYRDVSGISLCSGSTCSKTVGVKSSCFSSQNITVNFFPFVLQNQGGDTTYTPSYFGAIYTPALTHCGDPTTSITTEIYRFKGQVDLPGACSDFTFSFYENARNGSTNLPTTAYDFYIEAKLNNSSGTNSSPQFSTPPAYSLCLNRSIISFNSAREYEGDSVSYELTSALAGTINSTPSPINYSNGYTYLNPISSSTPLILDPQTGDLSLTPNLVGTYTLTLKISEYRYLPSINSYYEVGSIMRDYNISVTSSCNSQIDTNVFAKDTNQLSSVIENVSCGDSALKMSISPILASSLAPDGSDFAILNSKGQLLPIISAGYDPIGQSVFTDRIWLKLADTVAYNDTLTIYTRLGNDQNTLVNTCGNIYPVNDSTTFVVSDCQTWVGLNEKKITAGISVYPNPVAEDLTIDLDQKGSGEASLLNLQGKIIETYHLRQSVTVLDISAIPAGIYMLSVKTEDSQFNSKVQKI